MNENYYNKEIPCEGKPHVKENTLQRGSLMNMKPLHK